MSVSAAGVYIKLQQIKGNAGPGTRRRARSALLYKELRRSARTKPLAPFQVLPPTGRVGAGLEDGARRRRS
jgi:hypothetical protein